MKPILILAVIFFITANLFPQSSVIIHKNNGSGDETIQTSEIDSITSLTPPPTFQCGLSQVSYMKKYYNTVKIGTQCWLKENLDVGTQINLSSDQTNNGIIEKYCYNDLPVFCSILGGLYQWDEAMQYLTTTGARGICPTGWHIPTYAEFTTLETSVSGNSNAVKTIGWGIGSGVATNTSGFSALLSGARDQAGYKFYNIGIDNYLWTSTEYGTTSAYYIDIIASISIFGYGYFNNSKPSGFSVRCVKDSL